MIARRDPRIDPLEVLGHFRRHRGLLSIQSKIPIKDEYILSLVYTPGVAEPCLAIHEDPESSFAYTMRGNTVAILSDGSSVLSYGDAGASAAQPVMEGKAILFKTLAGLDAFPLCTTERDPVLLARMIQRLTPTFGGFSIEDIASPRSFELLEILEGLSDADLPVPFFFNDMQGACSIVLAALRNALKVVGKEIGQVRAVITGAGGAGISVARFLRKAGVPDITLCDRHGIVWEGRPEGMNRFKEAAARELNRGGRKGTIADGLEGADLFVGLSAARTVKPEMIRSMGTKPIVFALATPEPEIEAEAAREAGAAVVLTGGADYRHGLNVALAFPGILRGAIDARASRIYDEMLIAAADAIASLVPAKELGPARIIPRVLDLRVGPAVASAVANAAIALGVAREDVDPEYIGERTKHLVYEGETALMDHALTSERRTLGDEALELHRRYRGAIEVASKIPLKDEHMLLVIATPGVACPVLEIIRDPLKVWEYTTKGNLVAVVTDGSAVLGLGNIGPEAALPVMEGKCVLFKTFAGVEAIPICLGTQDAEEIIAIVKALEPSIGGVNLEDIAAPRCFEIERRLRLETAIPIFHDDQHGTAVVVLAGLLNALRLTERGIGGAKVTVNGAGAAGISVTRLLMQAGVKDVILCDRLGTLYQGRSDMNPPKEAIAAVTNRETVRGGLAEAMWGRDVFIGLSGPNLATPQMVRSMAPKAIVFALANPIPEIPPEAAKEAGAAVVATGRSDYPNQVNNAVAFPGIFRGALDVAARNINDPMKIAASHALADLIPDYELSAQYILPKALDFRGAPEVAAAVARSAIETGEARRRVDPRQILENTRDYLYGAPLRALPGEPIGEQPDLPLKR
ncbi:MAG TPA: malic enzyme-like NAD(P)-binding protein [Candidatus Polarisedimenticolia bacterium]|nr:malic enzyme-like NAD(P)-binding protein [Candidatus Polarisedimenticolia bacterium]